MKRQEFYRGTFFCWDVDGVDDSLGANQYFTAMRLDWGRPPFIQRFSVTTDHHRPTLSKTSEQRIIIYCRKSPLPLLLFREHEKCTVSYFFFWLYRRIIGKCGANRRLMIIIIMIFFIITQLGRTCTMRWRCSAWTPWSRRSLTWPTIYPGIYGNIYDFNIDLQIINQPITIYAVKSTSDVTNMTTTKNISIITTMIAIYSLISMFGVKNKNHEIIQEWFQYIQYIQ